MRIRTAAVGLVAIVLAINPMVGTSAAQASQESVAADPVLIYVEDGYGTESNIGDPPTFVEFKASLSGPSNSPVSFSYSTPTNACFSVNDTCASPVFDFIDSAGTVVFAPGETTKRFVVPIVPDSYSEPTEGFPVDLWAPVNGEFPPGYGWGDVATGWTDLLLCAWHRVCVDRSLWGTVTDAANGLSVVVGGHIGDDDRADGTPPTQPTGLTAQALKGQKIKLSWNASTDGESGLESYRIERSSSGSAFEVITTTTTTSYTDGGLTKGTTYAYRVIACDTSGNCSQPSNTASATAT